MKRYDLVPNYRCGEVVDEMELSDDGEWVRFENVTALRSALEALIQGWRAQAERHKKHGDCYRIGQGWGLEQCADELAALGRGE